MGSPFVGLGVRHDQHAGGSLRFLVGDGYSQRGGQSQLRQNRAVGGIHDQAAELVGLGFLHVCDQKHHLSARRGANPLRAIFGGQLRRTAGRTDDRQRP